MQNNKIVIISLIFNALLIVALVLFIVFGRTKPIEKYESEISRLETLNEGLEDDNVTLYNDKKAADDRIAQYDENLTKVSEALIESKKELERFKRKRNEIPDIVNELPDDSIAGELTNYLSRRTEKGRIP